MPWTVMRLAEKSCSIPLGSTNEIRYFISHNYLSLDSVSPQGMKAG
jgi:hypothetical protein